MTGAGLLIGCLSGQLRAAELIQLGGQTGAQIFFDVDRLRTFNFGVTSQGAGLEISAINVFIKRAPSASAPVVISLMDNFGGTGNVVTSATVGASIFSSTSFNDHTVTFSAPAVLRAGAYSIRMSTTGAEDFYFKDGVLSLTGSSGGILPMSQWVQDNNSDGTATTSLSTTSNVLADYSLSGTALSFGNYRIGSTLSQNLRVTNSSFATSNNVTEALVVSGSAGARATLSGLTTSSIAVTGSDDFTVALSSSNVGATSGTVALSFGSVKGSSNSTTTGTTSVGSAIITMTGTGYRTASASLSATSATLGKFHIGATNLTGTITISNSATNDGYSEGLVLTGSASSGVTLGSLSGLVAAGTNRSVVVGLSSVASIGTNSGTVLFDLTSSGAGTSGLSDLKIGSQLVNVSAEGYSGQAHWNTNAGGTWGSFGSWDVAGGTPGLDGALSVNDTATFGTAATSAATVRLDGRNPVLAALTFSNANASYDIVTGSGGTLTMGNGSSVGSITNSAGSHSISAGVVLSRNTSVTTDSGAVLTISGAISGTAALSKGGAGTLLLSGSNNYSGGTTVSLGALEFTNGALASSGTVGVNGGTLRWASGNSQDVSARLALGASGATLDTNGNNVALGQALNAAGALTKGGLGKLTLSGNNLVAGSMTIAGGMLEFGGSSTLGTSGTHNGAIANAGVLSFASSANQTVSGIISGVGALTKSGAGTLRLSGSNSYSGGTAVTLGALEFTNGALASSGTVAVNGGTLRWASGNSQDLSSRLALGASGATLDTNGNDVAMSQALNAAGALTKGGLGKLSLSGNNLVAGPVTIAGGMLEFGGSSTLGASGTHNGAISNAGVLSFASSANQTIAGNISGVGALAKSGSGTLWLSGSNNYSGGTTVSEGTLVVNGVTEGTVAVASGATLAGSGVIGGDTTVSGFHTPGNSPGLETFEQDLSYLDGSTLVWELAANTTTGRGTLYDAVDVYGDLSISGTVTLELAFDWSGSTVDWSDAFWASDQEWLVVSVLGITTGEFTLGGVSLDSQGVALGIARPGSSFSIVTSGNNVVLKYSSPENLPIPEPGVALLGGIGMMVLLMRRRRPRA